MLEHLRPPPNLSVVHHRGDKSFVEVIKNNKKLIAYKEAEPGKQMPDAAYRLVFQIALGLAKTNLQDHFHFTRYDQEALVSEDSNNEPFREANGFKKTIIVEGYEFKTHL